MKGELPFVCDVTAVRLRHDAVVVAVESHVHVYDLQTLRLLYKCETRNNRRGLMALSPMKTQYVTASATRCVHRRARAKGDWRA